jgi:hypothetical protein
VAQATNERLSKLEPQLNRLRENIGEIEVMISGNLASALRVCPACFVSRAWLTWPQASGQSAKSSLEDAVELKQLLVILKDTILDNNAEVSASATASQHALAGVAHKTQQVNNGFGVMVTVMASMQSQMVRGLASHDVTSLTGFLGAF